MADKREFKITCIIVIISVPAFLRKRPVKIPLESSVNNVRGKWITFQGVRKFIKIVLKAGGGVVDFIDSVDKSSDKANFIAWWSKTKGIS